MKNISVFPSQGGIATLILREIPYSQKAYIQLQAVIPENLPAMIQECGDFCRACGAEKIYICRKDSPEPLPLKHDHDIFRLTMEKSALPAGNPVTLTGIQEDNDSIYINIYNRCFCSVSNAAFYDRSQIQRIYLMQQQAFLALTEDGTPFGIGELHGNELAAIGVLPEFRGRGRDLALALLRRCPGPEVRLTVASDNPAALRLYEKIGFRQQEVVSSWYIL